jgi:hypothetical protein
MLAGYTVELVYAASESFQFHIFLFEYKQNNKQTNKFGETLEFLKFI